MNKLKNLRENLCSELEKVSRKEEINMNDLEVIDKLTHAIKNLDKVMVGNEMIDQYGYDFPRYSNEYSGARRGRDGDNDERYNEGRSRDSYNRSYERGYSGHDQHEIDRFKRMMEEAIHNM
jgi:hypothetical protein